MDYRMMDRVTEITVDREKQEQLKNKRLKHVKKKHQFIRFIGELTYVSILTAVIMYIMLVVTNWCLS